MKKNNLVVMNAQVKVGMGYPPHRSHINSY